MALSDYERRVLAEIEVEFRSSTPSPRRRRLRLIAILAGCLLILAAVGTVSALFLPAAAGAGLCCVAGTAIGGLLMLVYQRRRSL